jgi:bifunctional ADP-heptose synthase (sugar kinase/adenylyltransferase)
MSKAESTKEDFQKRNWSSSMGGESSSSTRLSIARLTSLLASISSYKVLLIGDGIVDEYVYVRPQGKSPKENIITNRIIRTETFRGGVWAAEGHVEEFCFETGIWRGEVEIIKRRFVEEGYMRKLFEVHEDRTRPMGYESIPIKEWDLVLVTDFGHGTVTPSMIGEMCADAKFLAVNAQTNSANIGFNLITKYPRADYVVVDELEARLAAHDRESPLEAIIERLGFPKIVVTRGKDGALGYDGEFHYEPAVADKVVDTMGAGDAFFCVTAPFAKAGASMPELLKIGNAAGAIKCGVVGHRQPVTKEGLLGYFA